jgi:diaminopimelate decarboxylase
MPATRDTSGALTLGGFPLATIAKDSTLATPTYAYDLDAIAREAAELDAAFEGAPHVVAYAVKANTAGPIVRTLARAGFGADVVSGAELMVARACGVPPAKIVYSGVAKTDDELARAIAEQIGAIQVESVEEIARVAARAKALAKRARVSIRVNPAVSFDALDTHAHIATGHDEAKFGVPRDDVARALELIAASPELALVGVTAHVGSQFTSTSAYVEAAEVLFELARDARESGKAKELAFVDSGGGFGIDYGDGCSVRPADFVRAARAAQRAARLDDLALYIEPGRSLVAAHGVLVARVIQAKRARDRRWLLIDAGMNDLIRPALYQARHRIVALDARAEGNTAWRVVGPVCESSDDFGEHAFADAPPEYVAILDAGAYGYTMASEYNGRQLPVEAFIRGGAIVARTERRAPDA